MAGTKVKSVARAELGRRVMSTLERDPATGRLKPRARTDPPAPTDPAGGPAPDVHPTPPAPTPAPDVQPLSRRGIGRWRR